MPISATGSLVSVNGAGITAVSVTSANAGDLIAFFPLIISNVRTVSALAGGTADAGGWTKHVGHLDGNTEIEMWTARVGTPGTANINVTWSGSVAGTFIGYNTRCFTAGLGPNTTWAVDGTATGQANGGATTCAYPSKTSSGAGRLYLGYGYGHSVALVPGSTPGVTYEIDSTDNCFLFNPNVSSTIAPTTGTTSTQTTAAIGALFSATGPSAQGPVPSLSQYNSFH